MDIPVYESCIESLHVLFSLYLEFKSNPIFQQQLAMDHDPTGYLSGTVDGQQTWGADGNASIGQAIAGITMPPGMGLSAQEAGVNVMSFN
jgi:hypothetical protein